MSNSQTDFELVSNGFSRRPGPVMIVVMDGVGIGPRDEGDAVHLARTPVLDGIAERFVHTQLKAHGTAVGLPSDGDMGNSEVGHNAIGAGRVFDQGAKLVNNAINSGKIFEGKTWGALLERVAGADGGALHFIGLLSDGNVHSHIDQLVAMVRRCDADGVARVRLHALLDGRDVEATSALRYVDRIEALFADINAKEGRDYRIASGGGRMRVTMDRYEADWGMVELGWRIHVRGEGDRFASAREAIEAARTADPDVIDQYLPAFVIADGDQPVGPIVDGDGVIFFNFRGDRAIEISRAFEDGDDFSAFDRGERPDVLYAGMMQYDGDLALPKTFLVEPPDIDRTMGEFLARNGLSQLACSETQKYGHVTYFWNGNRSGLFDEKLETYVNIPSDDVPFDQRPWMKSAEITDATIAALDDFDFVRVNYPSGDMVGHTGDFEAAVIAVQVVDHQIGRLLDALEQRRGVALITADHGNSDDMWERDKKTGEPKRDAEGRIRPRTSHTLNPVPLTIVDFGLPAEGAEYVLRDDIDDPKLSNLAATALFFLGYEAPEGYDASLVKLR